MQSLSSVGELEAHVCAAGEHECRERANCDREPLNQLHRPPPSLAEVPPTLCHPPNSGSTTFGGHQGQLSGDPLLGDKPGE